MLKNYLKTAWRNLAKNKAHSFINITGLSVGMCVAMLIAFWIYDELSYNRNFKNHDRIARVVQNVTNNGEVQTWQAMPWPLAQEIRTNYGADFKYVAMSTNPGETRFQYGDKKLSFDGVFFEESAPEMLDLKMIHGKRDALKDPSSILISESMAKAFFGDGEVINKVLRTEDSTEVKVAGVYKDLPISSSFSELKYIASWKLFESQKDGIKTMEDPWRPNAFQLYVQLNDGVDINQASLHIKDAKLKKVNPQLQKKKPALFLHPMKDWYLRDEFKSGFNIGGRIQYVWMFAIVGVFVLTSIACGA